MSPRPRLLREYYRLVVLLALVVTSVSCVSFTRFDEGVDVALALRAREAIPREGAGFQLASFQEIEEVERGEYYEDEPSRSVFVAELLAIFPGLFVHGLGHSYAGDHGTASRLRNMGGWGYAFTAVGGGLVTGAYFLDKSSDEILPISMYVAGGGVGAVGLAYFFSAWVLDIYDTPRAIRSGGRPWRYLQDEGDIFAD